jgi:hypothetical protein
MFPCLLLLSLSLLHHQCVVSYLGKWAYTGTLCIPVARKLDRSLPLWLMTEIFITENIFFLLYDSSCNKLPQFNQRHMAIKSHYWCGIVRGQNFNEWNLAHSFTPSTHSSPLHLMRPFYRRGVMELTSGHLQRMVTWKSSGPARAESLTCGRITGIFNFWQWWWFLQDVKLLSLIFSRTTSSTNWSHWSPYIKVFNVLFVNLMGFISMH